MERLTYRLEDQYGNPTDSIILESDLIFLNSSEKWKKVLSRLAAYEDTGLEPEEIISAVDMAKVACALEELNAYKELGSLDRLRALAEADREGWCVVLPCKRDDVLWTFHTYPSERVYSFHVTDLSTLNGRTMLNTDIMGVVDARDVGKTVFLTRAEAEKALKAREQDE